MDRSAGPLQNRWAGSELAGLSRPGRTSERPGSGDFVADGGDAAGVGRFQRRFVSGVALLLGLTGGLKLVGVLQEARVLAAADPLFPFLTLRQVLFLAAGLELGVAGVLLRHRTARWAPGVILWLVLVFGGYRLGRWAVGWEGPCGCLGHLFEHWPEFERWADQGMLAALAVMGLGSCLLIAKEVSQVAINYHKLSIDDLLRRLIRLESCFGSSKSNSCRVFHVEEKISTS